MDKPINNHKKVPAIRFQGFSGGWEEKTLDEVADIVGGGTPSTFISEYWNGDINWYSPTEIGDSRFVIKSKKKITELGLQKSSAKILPAHKTILFTSRASIGDMAILKADACTNQGFQSLVTKDGNYPYFLYSYGFLIKKYALTNASGSTFLEISGKQLGKMPIKLPTRQEQTQIGDFFQALDDLIAKREQKHAKLRKIKQALLGKLFPQAGETVPQMRFIGFSGEWEEKKIQEIFKVTRGNVLAFTETSTKPTAKMPYPVYSSQTKNNGLMGYYNKFLFENAITWTTDGAHAGTVNYRAEKFYSTNVNGVLLSSEGFANKAIAELLNLIAWKHVSHVGNPKLMNNVMSEIKINIPSLLKEQKEISALLNAFDTLIDQYEQQITTLKNIKQGYLNKMFI